jgi:hypothetical protein
MIVLWPTTSIAAEMWFGHGLTLTSVIDAQLIQAYRSTDGVCGWRGFIKLNATARRFEGSDEMIHLESEINMERFFESSLPFKIMANDSMENSESQVPK